MIAIAADAFGTIFTSDKPRTIRNKNLLLMPFFAAALLATGCHVEMNRPPTAW
jgi:hypothetical protein